MLEVRDLHAFYGKSHILHGVNLSIRPGEIVSLLGRNGVGRSTTVKAVMGMVQCRGSVKFKGEEIAGLKAYRIAHRGLGYVPENRDIFPSLTVRQNLLLGQKSAKAAGRWKMDDMFELFPRLRERVDTQAGFLSGGEQQMLTLARALGRKPKLLLADELSLGLAPLVVDRLLQAVRRAADEQGTAVIMVEQHAHKALVYTDHAIVMRRGIVALDLSGEDARHRIGEVEQAYLTSAGGDIEHGEQVIKEGVHEDV
jgi:branched-chain amino acid transport system ATP-binding protein